MNKEKIPHPAFFINSKLTEDIRSFALEAEKAGSLHPRQLAIIYEQKWFNLFVAKKYNGLQLPFPEALQIEEGLAWVDGSIGWTVTLCAGANWFVGFLHPEIAMIIFNTDTVCLAGSGRPSGVAKITEEGYEVTGYWKYATGSAHATAFTANCIIEKDGISVKEDGSPLIKSFVFLRDEVILHKDWDCMGMIATSSNSFEVQQLRVHENRCFIIDPNFALIDHPVYQYPFLQFAEATLAVNISGMAINFMDLCETLLAARAQDKDSDTEKGIIAFNCLRKAKETHAAWRQSFYSVIESSWKECLQNKIITPSLLEEVSRYSKELATTSRNLVNELYPYCGLKAAYKYSELNRVWRDLHTASQHSLLL